MFGTMSRATPPWHDATMSGSRTATFLEAARVIGAAAVELDCTPPGFRTPPRILGANRTVRRAPDGPGGVVAVRVSGRPFIAVVADMVEGVVVLNRLAPDEADRVRTGLWRALESLTASPLPPAADSPTDARVA
ncbi:MAG: hypothetical protein RL330_113 [Actinomycetota bacterium]